MMAAKKKDPNKPEYYDDLDIEGWREVMGSLKSLRSRTDDRQTNWSDIEDMIFMDWKNSGMTKAKQSVDPGPRNKVGGVRNLLTSTLPTFNLPHDKNDPGAEKVSGMIEKAANTIWIRSNRVQGISVESGLATAGTTFDEMHVRVVSTKDDLVVVEDAFEAAKDDDDFDEDYWTAEIEEAERIHHRTPFTFELISPKIAHPAWTKRRNMVAYYTEEDLLVADIKRDYGERATRSIGTKKDHEVLTVCNWHNKIVRYAWVKKASEPMLAEKTGLKFMTIVARRVVGTDLFASSLRQNEPFLYTALKSGVWKGKNAILTATRTNLNKLMNAQFFYQMKSAEDKLKEINFKQIGNVIQGEGRLTPLGKIIMDQNVMAMWEVLDQLFEDSTIYGQALGERLSGNTTFSETALLAQQGRLPIVPIQKALAETMAQAMEIAFRWWKEEGMKWEEYADLDPGKIPDILEFEVNVEPDLPQDKVQAATVAGDLNQKGLASKRWGRENLLNVGQSDEMQSEIWSEIMSEEAFKAGVGQTLAIAQQAAEGIQGILNGLGGGGEVTDEEGRPEGMMRKPKVMPDSETPPEDPQVLETPGVQS